MGCCAVERVGRGFERVEFSVPSGTFSELRAIAGRLGVSVGDLLRAVAEALADYSGDIVEWGLELRVRREHRVDSLAEEIIDYAVAAHKYVVNRILDLLRARGRFELEHLELIPEDSTLIVELVALEGSDLLADRVRIVWTPRGVLLEAYYYLEEDEEPPLRHSPAGVNWDYLPDEHAVVVSVEAPSISDLPPIHVLDEKSGL